VAFLAYSISLAFKFTGFGLGLGLRLKQKNTQRATLDKNASNLDKSPEVDEWFSKSGSRINNSLFTYTPVDYYVGYTACALLKVGRKASLVYSKMYAHVIMQKSTITVIYGWPKKTAHFHLLDVKLI